MYRPIQAKAVSPGEQQSSRAPEPPPMRPKSMSRRNITTVACQPCRKRKSKCDGVRPECSSCQHKGTSDQCFYEADTDKKAALRKKVAILEKELEDVKQTLPLLVASTNKEKLAQLVQELQQNGISKVAVETTKQLYQELNQTSGESSSASDYTAQRPQSYFAPASLYPSSSAEVDPGLSYLSAPVAFEYPETADQLFTEPFLGQEAYGHHQPSQPFEQRYDPEDEYLREYFRKLSLGHDPRTTPGPERLRGRQDSSQDNDTSSSSSSSPRPPGVRLPRPSSQSLQLQHGAQAVIDSDYIHIFGNLPMSSSVLANYNPESIQQTQAANFRLPLSSIQALNFEDHPPSKLGAAGALSTIYTDFRQMKRRLIAEGLSEADAIGPVEVDFETVYSGQNLQRASTTSASSFTASISAVAGLAIPEKIACAYVNKLMMQWQIAPSPATYAELPEWLRPSSEQLFVVHHACIDYLPWPAVREALLASSEDFVAEFTNGLSVNWPLEPEDTVILDPETGVTMLNPVFESHIRDVMNWSLDSNVVKKLPYLKGTVRINDEAARKFRKD